MVHKRFNVNNRNNNKKATTSTQNNNKTNTVMSASIDTPNKLTLEVLSNLLLIAMVVADDKIFDSDVCIQRYLNPQITPKMNLSLRF